MSLRLAVPDADDRNSCRDGELSASLHDRAGPSPAGLPALSRSPTDSSSRGNASAPLTPTPARSPPRPWEAVPVPPYRPSASADQSVVSGASANVRGPFPSRRSPVYPVLFVYAWSLWDDTDYTRK